VAVLVREALSDLGNWDVKIIGLDVNPAVSRRRPKPATSPLVASGNLGGRQAPLLSGRRSGLRARSRNSEDGDFRGA